MKQPMGGSGRILAATDLSEGGDLSVTQAHWRAAASGARLGVCVVTPGLDPASPLLPHPHGELARQLMEVRRRIGERAIERVQALTDRGRNDFEVILAEGSPSAAIVHTAEEWDADLLVVGSRAAEGIGRALLGSVAERVVRQAHCPVLVCRWGSHARHIVVGTDFSDPALPALAAARDEALLSGDRITAMHCLDTGLTRFELGTAFGGLAAAEEAQRELLELSARRLEAAVASCRLDAEARVTVGPAAAELVRAAEQLDAGLLVVGTRGRTGLRRMLLGSVAEAVVRSAPCSVLVVRLNTRAR